MWRENVRRVQLTKCLRGGCALSGWCLFVGNVTSHRKVNVCSWSTFFNIQKNKKLFRRTWNLLSDDFFFSRARIFVFFHRNLKDESSSVFFIVLVLLLFSSLLPHLPPMQQQVDDDDGYWCEPDENCMLLFTLRNPDSWRCVSDLNDWFFKLQLSVDFINSNAMY